MRIFGFRLAYGSWKMICSLLRSLRMRSLDSVPMSSPRYSTWPALQSSRRSTVRPIVLLPEPDSPTRPSVSPRRIANDTPSTARTGLSLDPK